MTFTRFGDGTQTVKDALELGYIRDKAAGRQMDSDYYTKICRERGRNFADSQIDAFEDFTGPLYEDEDGELYAVQMVWDDEGYRPLVWYHLIKND